MNRDDLQQLSKMRQRDAKALLDSGRYEAAYYLMGYAVECALKACIARKTQRYDFPELGIVRDSYTHDLTKLMRLAELEHDFKQKAAADPEFSSCWSIVIGWSESRRYMVVIRRDEAYAFYKACTKRKGGVLTWLRHHW